MKIQVCKIQVFWRFFNQTHQILNIQIRDAYRIRFCRQHGFGHSAIASRHVVWLVAGLGLEEHDDEEKVQEGDKLAGHHAEGG